jgi:hypothetical protein
VGAQIKHSLEDAQGLLTYLPKNIPKITARLDYSIWTMANILENKVMRAKCIKSLIMGRTMGIDYNNSVSR